MDNNNNEEEVKLTACILASIKFDNKMQGGLRTRNIFKQNTQDQPLLTVITVVFNGDIHLEETIQSILNQTYKNIEYIVVDGGSSDGTLEIIQKYDSFIDYWVSESDCGIYDAMNKGASLSNGNWINFMNAGDLFCDNSTVDSVFLYKNGSSGVLYGDTIFSYGNFKKKIKSKELKEFFKGMPFIHQSAFIRSDLQRQRPFKTSMKIAADFDLFYEMYLNGVHFTRCDLCVSVATLGGLSDNKRIDSVLERWGVVNSHGANLRNFFYFSNCLIIEMFKFLLKVLLPNILIMKIQKSR